MKIALLSGNEETFPNALMERISALGRPDLSLEIPTFHGLAPERLPDVDLVIDRVSGLVPFFGAVTRLAARQGLRVVNDPGRVAAEDTLTALALARQAGIETARALVLPNKTCRPDVGPLALRNLAFPIDWETLLKEVGGTGHVRPLATHGRRFSRRVTSASELVAVFDQSGETTLVLVEDLKGPIRLRVHVLGDQVVIAGFDGETLRCLTEPPQVDTKILDQVKRLSLELTVALGLEINVLEWVVDGDRARLFDAFDPQGDLDFWTLTEEPFHQVVDAALTWLVRRVDFQRTKTQGTKVLAAGPAPLPASMTPKAAPKPPAAPSVAVSEEPSSEKSAPAPKSAATSVAAKPVAAPASGTSAAKPAAKPTVLPVVTAPSKVVTVKSETPKPPEVKPAKTSSSKGNKSKNS